MQSSEQRKRAVRRTRSSPTDGPPATSAVQPSHTQAEREARSDAFFQKFGRESIRGLPKYARLREAIAAAIDDGYWVSGDRLPTEAELVRCTPFSLGTVQRALRSLVEEGIVTRAQGSGTFVAQSRQQMEAPWHCRFLNADETAFLPVYPKLVSRKRITGKGPWSAHIGHDGGAVIQIDRRLGIGDEFFVYSRLYMTAARFAALLKKPVRDIEAANLKAMIGRDFHLPITRIGQCVSLARFGGDVCRVLRVATGTVGMLMECVATARAGVNVYYQQLYIPPNERRLIVSDSDAAWGIDQAAARSG
jgi:DNA-binding GntR family transcriptional regulator